MKILNPAAVSLSLVLTVGVATGQATWNQLTFATEPGPRTGASGVSDLSGMLVFGGNANAGRLDELWRLDPFATGGPTWTNLAPAGPTPVGRNAHAAAYDLARGVLVIFGGRTASGNPGISDETWEWNSFTNTWADLTPATPNHGVNTPPHLENAQMVFDLSANRCLLFGGRGNGTTAPTEYGGTWSWDGTSWTELTPTNTPPARRNHAMAHDPVSGTTVVWGGIAAGVVLGDTWTWDGSDWTNVPTAAMPFANATHNGSLLNQMAYDTVRERFVLTSGTYPGGTSLTDDDTWEFDGSEWVNRGTSGSGKRYHTAFAFVEAAGRSFRFGGYNAGHQNQTWEYGTAAVAAVSSYGAGCAGQSGAGLMLVADNSPWAGDTWSATCTTMGPASLALSAYGFTTAALPLDALLPGFGVPGCTLLNSAESVLGPAIPAAGSVTISLPLPADPALAGFQLHAQVAEIDFGLTSLWTSNGLTMTIGVR